MISLSELSRYSVLSVLGSVFEDDGEFVVEEGGLVDEGRSGRNFENLEEDEEDVFAERVAIRTVAV